jgi:hypothetical protein
VTEGDGQNARRQRGLYEAAREAADPSVDRDTLEGLITSLKTSRKAPLTLAAELLEDPHVPPTIFTGLARLWPEFAPGALRGAAGLTLMLADLQLAAHSTAIEPSRLEYPSSLLADGDVATAFRDYYGLKPIYDLAEATIYRVGTTSFIVHCSSIVPADNPVADNKDLALKCLLPRYLAVRTIRDQTSHYLGDHGQRTPYAPRVYESTPSYIAMDFVAGLTLGELLASRPVIRGQTDIELLRLVGLALCRILGELERQGQHHLDLSPSNIIVDRIGAEEVGLKLVDFGHNYLITERVGSNAAFRRAALYVAPELIVDPTNSDVRCDLYSLGIMLLEGWTSGPLAEDAVNGHLAALWEDVPGLARIVEDLIDPNPDYRLLLMPARFAGRPYEYVGALLTQETEVLEAFEKQTGHPAARVLQGRGLVALTKRPEFVELLEAADSVDDPADDAYLDTPRLASWARRVVFLWRFTVAAFLALTVADLVPAGWAVQEESLARSLHAQFHVGHFWANLPGRAVALTFALTVVTYYVNIYSTLAPRTLATKLTTAADLVSRPVLPIVTFVPILWALLYQPRAWPICSGIGTLIVVVNNWLYYHIAVKASREAEAVGLRRFVASAQEFLKSFTEWWRLMLLYSCGLFAGGGLLIAGVAKDWGIYAAIVCILNVEKLYMLNCVKFAPFARGHLARSVCNLRRVQRATRDRDRVPADTSALEATISA